MKLGILLLLLAAAALADERNARTAIVYDDVFKRHDTGPFHPERARRCTDIMEALRAEIPAERLLEIKPRKAEDSDILLCHTKEYLDIVKQDTASGASMLRTGDTPICAESLEAARYAAGAVLEAVDAVFEGKAANAFCVVRPPGHHAESARGMGFCIFNNAAIGARYAQRKHQIERVMILDWDVHHGNGTEEIFYSDPSVMFVSIHQSPLYPGTGQRERTGEGAGKGFNINLPVPAETTGSEFVRLFREAIAAQADAFKPQLVIISAGFDALEDDPLGSLLVSIQDFAELTRLALDVAQRHASGRLVSVLEGGYHGEKLGEAAAAHVGVLAEPRK